MVRDAAVTVVTCPDCGNNYHANRVHVCPKVPGDANDRDVVAEITRARGSIYGPFLHNAIVGQAIRSALRTRVSKYKFGPEPVVDWEDLPLDVREGLDYIAGKMSRIVTGDPEYLDNWDDIGGFAKIVADRIRKTKGG